MKLIGSNGCNFNAIAYHGGLIGKECPVIDKWPTAGFLRKIIKAIVNFEGPISPNGTEYQIILYPTLIAKFQCVVDIPGLNGVPVSKCVLNISEFNCRECGLKNYEEELIASSRCFWEKMSKTTSANNMVVHRVADEIHL